MERTDTDMRLVQEAMERLGFTLAAQTLHMRWPGYSQIEREKIIVKWRV